MGAELLTSEFVMMKDTVWKLSSRVLLLEGFIKQQFGNVFWQFCEDQVKGVGEEQGDLIEQGQEEEDEEEGLEEDELIESKPLPMPPMIPILSRKQGPPPPTSTNPSPPAPAPSTPPTPVPAPSAHSHPRKSIPPPPPLSLMRAASNSASSGTPPPKTRNFLPKSFTTTKSPGSKLPPSITITPTTGSHQGSGGHSKMGGNGRITPSGGGGGGVSILKEKISENLSSYQIEPEPHPLHQVTTRVKLEAAKTGLHRRSPAPPAPPALIMSRGQGQGQRISNHSRIPSHSLLQHQFHPLPHPLQHQFYHHHQDEEEGEEEYEEGDDRGDYYQGESPGEESEGGEEGEMYGDGGYLAAELVSATLCPPEEEDQDQGDEGEELLGEGEERVHKKIRLSLGAASTSSSASYLNGGGGGGGSNGSGGGGSRQMRPNPCHARCQNRCHDIWTDGDRMGVFQTYWAIPNEEERREFVASRIERVDMATKRTEFSNFRTCTFKYYLPHPENAWVQVCKNFFLATIDEKRSYIEKIAQSVKGDAGGEKVSTKNIPFRRRNQMQRSLVEDNYAGWMQGLGLDPSMLDDPDLEGGQGQGYDLEQGDEQEGDGEDGDGMEMMEDEGSLQD